MSVKDSAMKLANEIRNSKEYKDFRKNMNEVKKDKSCEKLLKEYQDIQIKAQGYVLRNQEVDKKVIMKLESIGKKVSNNKKVYNYLNSEQRFKSMMDDINKILAKSVEKDYK